VPETYQISRHFCKLETFELVEVIRAATEITFVEGDSRGTKFLPQYNQKPTRIQFALPRRSYPNMQSITDEGFLETKYERLAEIARVMTEGEAVVLVVLNGKEGTGYAVNADSGLNELLPSILRRIAKLIGPED
jgi:hypothetical protein